MSDGGRLPTESSVSIALGVGNVVGGRRVALGSLADIDLYGSQRAGGSDGGNI